MADAVARWLAVNPKVFNGQAAYKAGDGFEDYRTLWVDAPPTLSNQPPPDELEQALNIARHFDVAERQSKNRDLGRAGERLVLAYEKQTLRTLGRPDLADEVRWVADLDGDGLGYDIASFKPDGAPRLIEVKTTNGWERTPFHMTRNELAVSEDNPSDWCLFRLWNFAREPKAFELYPPLGSHVTLIATSYIARFD